MIDRVHHGASLVAAPIAAGFGLAWTVVAGGANAATDAVSLIGQAPTPSVVIGEYGGYLLSAGAVAFTLLQGWSQARLRQESEERKAWRAELIEATKAAGRAEALAEKLRVELDEAKKLAARAYLARAYLKSKDAKTAADAASHAAGATSNPELKAGEA